MVARTVHGTVMHDHQQTGCLPVRATKRSAGVGLDAERTKHVVEGKAVGDALGVEAGDTVSTSAQGVPPRLYLMFSAGALSAQPATT